MKEIKDQALRQDSEATQHSPFVSTIAQRAGVEPDEIRIQMGRRVVYGELASGEVRRELSGDRADNLKDALAIEQSITATAQYRGKIPAIEIRAGEEVLFRQERDGAVTQNLLADQMKEQSLSPASVDIAQIPPVVAESIDTAKLSPREKAVIILEVADRLANPVEVDEPIAPETEIAGYHINTTGAMTTLFSQERFLLRSDDPQMRISTEPDAIDVQAFQVFDALPPARDEPVPISVFPAQFEAIAVFQQQVGQIEDSGTRQFCENLGSDVERQATLLQNLEKSISQGVVQTKAALSEMKQELVDDWKAGLSNAGNWLLSRADAILDQNLTQSAYQLFNRGFERTGEEAYRQDGFEVKRTGDQQFTVSDRQGELMKFSVSAFDRMQILEKSDRLERSDYEAFRQFKRSQVVPQGHPKVESLYDIRSRAAAQTAREFLQQTNVNPWDAEGGHYRIELQGGDRLTVTAKDGRGVVLEQSQEGIMSKLGRADFDRFDETRRMLDSTRAKVAVER